MKSNSKIPLLLLALVVLGGVYYLTRYQKKDSAKAKSSAPKVALSVDPKAKAVLVAAREACRGTQCGEIEASYQGQGAFAEASPRIQGKVQFCTTQNWFRADVIVSDRRRQEAHLEQISDGKQCTLVDHANRQFVVGDYPFARRLLFPASRLVPPEFGDETAFATALESGLKHEGVRDVNGAPCDVVLVTYREKDEAARWALAQSDHLPRRVERIYNNFAGNEDRDKTVLNIKALHPKTDFSDTHFAAVRPEGFEEVAMRGPEPLIATGQLAPDWELKTPEGGTIRLADLKGNIVVLDFWATWCGPCKIAMPKVQELHADMEGKPVKIFGVNCMEDEGGDPMGYMKSKGYTYGLLLKGDDVAKAYKVSGIPTFYVIDPQGKVAYASVGAGDEESLRRAVVGVLETREQ